MSNLDPVLMSRLLTGLTLFVHVNFATIGVGVPLMIALAEWRGVRRNDLQYILMARRWARGFVISVAVGVVTGTAISLQLSLLWPTFIRVAGQAVALPMFMETFAFFIEAIFMGLYLYTWDRFKNRYYHLLLLIPIAIGATASTFFITSMNAFMNNPQGFTLKNGVFTDVDPWSAMFNPATPTKVSHVLAASYTASAGLLAGIAAFSLLRGRKHDYYKKALKLTVTAAFVFAVSTAIIGDFSGKYLARYQPEKLAAAEWHFETMERAPLIYGGILDENNQVKYAIRIPYALSILAGSNPNAKVMGLDEIPKENVPPLSIHYMFDLKVTNGVLLVLIPFLYLVRGRLPGRFKIKGLPKWLLVAIVALVPLAFVAIELGWFFAEVGRQPWIVRGYMRVSEAATTSHSVGWMLVLFVILYLVLCYSCLRVLHKMFKNKSAEEELQEMAAAEGGWR
ncbi:cytochrome ubiquinol oxidase subunit I [Paenibacillus sp. CAA11]|uniref:cytochrome ubiquinol oxidase subunit I n=1 Tax=Paenibacillus sp. CAA11 TaxID=1532905 RepID=UPI000D368B51|nr:cytochrome ubiquinol oxidase subunit I [Paenibacillus sp. CAA11]AWB45999.1 cytochrome ubiquinol oxidase subunit I [Paenibacillus sp. CAA11]